MAEPNRHRVVIVGGGFAGLYCAQGLRRSPVGVTLIDRRNFHLFQPLLYQVATGALSAANIAAPLRGVLGRQRNAVVLLGEVTDIDPSAREVVLADGDRVPFDTLVVAAGATHHYFGHDADWEPIAPGLKTVEDATEVRRKLLSAFERAERATHEARKRLLTLVVVGGGPTGVEMAGSVRELASQTLRRDFRFFDPADARVIVVESQSRVLAGFHENLSRRAGTALDRLGIEVINDSRVTAVAPDHVVVTAKADRATRRIDTETVIWAAGVKASPLLGRLADRIGVEADASGHLSVAPDCTVPGHPWLFVIGDCATFRGPDGKPLPGVAPVATQQGRYVADVIDRRARGLPPPAAFRYRDKGSMATVSRSQAVVDLGWVRFGGKLAWLTWLFIHILYLARFENRVLVLVQWAWNYISRNRAARLITGELTSVSPDARHDARGIAQARRAPDAVPQQATPPATMRWEKRPGVQARPRDHERQVGSPLADVLPFTLSSRPNADSSSRPIFSTAPAIASSGEPASFVTATGCRPAARVSREHRQSGPPFGPFTSLRWTSTVVRRSRYRVRPCSTSAVTAAMSTAVRVSVLIVTCMGVLRATEQSCPFALLSELRAAYEC